MARLVSDERCLIVGGRNRKGVVAGQVFLNRRTSLRAESSSHVLLGSRMGLKTKSLVTGLSAARTPDLPSKPVSRRAPAGGFDSRPPPLPVVMAHAGPRSEANRPLHRLKTGACPGRRLRRTLRRPGKWTAQPERALPPGQVRPARGRERPKVRRAGPRPRPRFTRLSVRRRSTECCDEGIRLLHVGKVSCPFDHAQGPVESVAEPPAELQWRQTVVSSPDERHRRCDLS